MTPDHYDRLVDELALVLCSVPDLGGDDTCIEGKGFKQLETWPHYQFAHVMEQVRTLRISAA
jgi:hypothetical protein